ncbi:MAG: sulfatase [Phycisphaeraceae bacterium]
MLRSALFLFVVMLLGACETMPWETPAPVGPHPNVIVIITDDQRWDAMSVAGHPHLRTPHIDRIANEGFYFRNTFCTTSLCSPSRASILSGLYAHRHGVSDNFTEYPSELKSFPMQLQGNGYDTAYIGKWHMGENNDNPRPGFNHFVTHKGQGKYFDTEFNFNGKERKVVPGYYTTVVTDMAIEWMNKRHFSEKPFLLMIGHKAPHSFYYPEPKYEHVFDHVDVQYPLSAFQLDDKPEWIKKRLTTWHGIYGPLFDYRKKFPDSSPEAVKDFAAMNRAYWGTLLSVDDSVGKLYEALEKSGRLNNTVIIFMGDNGLLSGEHGMVDKRTMHEASIRIPLVMRYPLLRDPVAKGTPGKPIVIDQQVLTVDIAPSVLDLCNVRPLKKSHGMSFKRLARGDPTGWRNAWYYEYNYEKQFPYTPNVRGIRTDEWKYMHYPPGDGGPDEHKAELYRIAEDPAESVNLIDDARHATTLIQLKSQLKRLQAAADGLPDKMPKDEGIKSGLPDPKIR